MNNIVTSFNIQDTNLNFLNLTSFTLNSDIINIINYKPKTKIGQDLWRLKLVNYIKNIIKQMDYVHKEY